MRFIPGGGGGLERVEQKNELTRPSRQHSAITAESTLVAVSEATSHVMMVHTCEYEHR